MTTYGIRWGSIDFEYDCEACGKHDRYSQSLEANFSNQSGGFSGASIADENEDRAIKRLERQRDKILASYDGIKPRKCPSCGHYQSWMAKGIHRRKMRLVVAGLSFIAWLILAVAVFATVPEPLGKNSAPICLGSIVVCIAGVGLYLLVTGEKFGPKVITAQLSKPPTMVWKNP